MGMIHYFAYGSNMLTTGLRARTPSANPLHLAELPGRRLAFHKECKDGSGKCDIALGAPDDWVVGVVFRLEKEELPDLDKAEGVGYGYERVEVLAAGNGTEIRCVSYEATKTDPDRKPYGWYRRLVIAGLLEHSASDWYLDCVRSFDWHHDPLPGREERQNALRALAEFRQAYPHLALGLSDVDDDFDLRENV